MPPSQRPNRPYDGHEQDDIAGQRLVTVPVQRWQDVQARLGARRHHEEAFVARERGEDPEVSPEEAVPAYIFDKLEALTHGPTHCARRARRRLTQVRVDGLRDGRVLPVSDTEIALDVISDTEPYVWPPGDWAEEVATAFRSMGVPEDRLNALLAELTCLPDAAGPRRYAEVQWPECHPDDRLCPRPPAE